MNIIKISDGLGNHMFQYAFARKLQIDTGKRVYLDTRFINNEDIVARQEDRHQSKKNSYREYGLDKFKIKLNKADDNMLKRWKYLTSDGMMQSQIYKMAKIGVWPWRYYDETLAGARSQYTYFFPTYYKGYFFHLKYYDDIRPILQKEFVLSEKIRIFPLLKKVLQKQNTVSIHVRRGDFLRLNRDISQKVYYPKALVCMSNKVPNPCYLVFSDDIEWVKSNIEFTGSPIYISEMGFQDYEELMIMKHCKHNIIANSTFSYWAAYLNSNPNKVVICPKRWKTDIIPKDWISL